jgi:hypothetical protein
MISDFYAKLKSIYTPQTSTPKVLIDKGMMK